MDLTTRTSSEALLAWEDLPAVETYTNYRSRIDGFIKDLGKRKDPAAQWARIQLAEESAAVAKMLADRPSVEREKTALREALKDLEKAQWCEEQSRNAEALVLAEARVKILRKHHVIPAHAALLKACQNAALKGISRMPLYHGLKLHDATVSVDRPEHTARLKALAPELRAYESDRNNSCTEAVYLDRTIAADQMVFEVASEGASPTPAERIAFKLR